MQNCKTTHVTCNCLKIFILFFFFLLNSRNAVCILVVLVAGILTATYSLLFVKNDQISILRSLLIANVFQESKMSLKTMLFYSKLFILHPGDIFVWHKLLFCHLPAISLLPLPHFVINMQPQVKNMTNNYFFHLRQHSNGSLRKRMVSSAGSTEVMSVGCTWLISIHVVYFVLW